MILRNLRSFITHLDTLEALAHPLPRFPQQEPAQAAPLCNEARAWYIEELPPAFRRPAWDHEPADAFEKRIGRARAGQDQQAIRDIFRKAAGAPMVDEARAWAEEYGVRFIVDYTCTAAGYYQPGTGTVALARMLLDRPAAAAGILVHEIAHAKQDALGLLPPPNSFFLYNNIAISFLEAQATAFQKTAKAQAARMIKGKDPAAHGRVLWDDFTGWYAPTDRKTHIAPPGSNGSFPDIYGTWTAQGRGYSLRLPGIDAPGFYAEFSPRARRHAPFELRTLEEEFMLLDSDFKGRPWFDKSAAKNFMKGVLDPGRAMRFYNRDEPPALVRRVLLAEERLLNPLPFREQIRKTFEEVSLYFAQNMLETVMREGIIPRRKL